MSARTPSRRLSAPWRERETRAAQDLAAIAGGPATVVERRRLARAREMLRIMSEGTERYEDWAAESGVSL